MKNIKAKFLLLACMIIFLGLLVTGCGKVTAEDALTYLKNEDYSKAVEVYNNLFDDDKSKDKVLSEIQNDIDSALERWSCNEIEYEDVKAMLEAYSTLNDESVANNASNQLDIIKVEFEGTNAMLAAEELFSSENYLSVLKKLKEIDRSYSQYDFARQLYTEAKDIYIMEITYPETIKEYEGNIKDIRAYLEKYKDADLAKELERIEKDFSTFEKTILLINAANEAYEKGDYSNAFDTINSGLKKYPDDIPLKGTADELKAVYVIKINEDITKLADKEKYDEAIKITEEANNICPCEEFEYMEDAIKDENSAFHKIVSGAIDSVFAFFDGCKQEVLEVKNDGFGPYIIKSGKKFFLGDYTEENVTVLSTGGNVAASFIGIDAIFDARDLVYDVQNWGEGEQFVVKIATDAIALVPVIGAVKYFKYLKKTEKTIDVAEDSLKALENLKETKEGIVKHYEYKDTINKELINKKHPKSGVEFKANYVKYSDGRWLKGVFPVFESKADLQLPKSLYKASFVKQQSWLNKKLQKKIKNNPNLRNQFSEEDLADIENGITPNGYTWHHNEKEGLMQLVDTVKHDQTGHDGGMSLWGQGYGKSSDNK
ncbi:MAG: HNH endonuclease [Emergencia sp.]